MIGSIISKVHLTTVFLDFWTLYFWVKCLLEGGPGFNFNNSKKTESERMDRDVHF